MKTLKVVLNQHTPLIHFQHGQHGATLRASEVKPQLDKYILAKLGLENYKALCIDDCLSLDYKMKVIVPAEEKPIEYLIASGYIGNSVKKKPKNVIVLSNTPFFAQENVNVSSNKNSKAVICKSGDKKYREYEFQDDNWELIEKKGLKWQSGKIEIHIVSFKSGVVEIIDEHICSFFAVTNFGSRSDKGFGSFTVDKKVTNIDKPSKIDSFDEMLSKGYDFVYKKEIKKRVEQGEFSDPDLMQKIFETIKKDYQILKSGFNFYEYKKSLLFCYAVEKMNGNPRWEKRRMKQIIKTALGNSLSLKSKLPNSVIYRANPDKQGWLDPMKFNYLFLRAMLGLAERYEFLTTDNSKKIVVKIESNEKDQIERFKSPIFFKVINNVLYMAGNEINEDIFDKEFKFSYHIEDTKRNLGRDGGPQLEALPNVIDEEIDKKRHYCYHFTPRKEDFSLVKFMDYAVKYKDTGGALVLGNYMSVTKK